MSKGIHIFGVLVTKTIKQHRSAKYWWFLYFPVSSWALYNNDWMLSWSGVRSNSPRSPTYRHGIKYIVEYLNSFKVFKLQILFKYSNTKYLPISHCFFNTCFTNPIITAQTHHRAIRLTFNKFYSFYYCFWVYRLTIMRRQIRLYVWVHIWYLNAPKWIVRCSEWLNPYFYDPGHNILDSTIQFECLGRVSQ